MLLQIIFHGNLFDYFIFNRPHTHTLHDMYHAFLIHITNQSRTTTCNGLSYDLVWITRIWDMLWQLNRAKHIIHENKDKVGWFQRGFILLQSRLMTGWIMKLSILIYSFADRETCTTYWSADWRKDKWFSWMINFLLLGCHRISIW